ncbi:MAG: sn-glycerol-3-phosphate ABC transporter ATP-binding protein UgpC [Rhodospirillales bacterium]|nr:sn-glycerol-3-phosphate ABC transporter ATP-binding protein UgpC [Rhodospirillales bacterium]
MAEVTLENVDKHYGEIQVLFDVSLTAEEGEFVVFVGPSGCGKSTLLRAVAGLEDISAGTIRIGGDDVTSVPPSERGVAMVFQSYALYPHMSVRDNMEFGLKVNKIGETERQKRVLDAARILQLEEYLDRKPGQLSGGQRQRVAIGRAIVKEPRVFLFDEPLSNLDAALRVQMRVELENLHSTLGSTMIYVTHDQVEAMTLADKIVVLNDGYTEQIGSPLDLYHRPQTQFVAGFIGSPKMNFLPVRFTGADGSRLSLLYGDNSAIATDRFAAPEAAGTELTLGIRPEHLVACDAGEGDFPATVEVVEALGSETYIYADAAGGERIIVKAQGDAPAARGDLIGLSMEKGREHLFDENGKTLIRMDS